MDEPTKPIETETKVEVPAVEPEPIFEPEIVSVSSLPAKEEMPEAEKVESSTPEPTSSPEPTPNTTKQEAFSSNPKLNAAALSFISYMGRTKETLALANKARKAQMMKRVYKVMDLFKKSMPPHTSVNKWVVGEKKIKNKDVRDFIHTDDSTATKYLNILVKEGKIKRIGKPHGAYYTKAD